jgi:dUTP pyrophosphatase
MNYSEVLEKAKRDRRKRGFEVTNVLEFPLVETKLPTRGTGKSSGYDFYLKANYFIQPNEICMIWTDVKAYMQDDETLKLFARSSIKGLLLTNSVGVVDADYYSNPKNDGNIGFKVWNYTDKPIELKQGDRIGQGVFTKYLITDDDEPLCDKRVGGYGSTGV